MVLPALNPPMIPPMSGAPAPPGPPMPGMMMGAAPSPPPGLLGPIVPPNPMMGMMGPPPTAPANPFAMMAPANPLLQLLMDPEMLTRLLGPQALPRDRQKWQEPSRPTVGQMLSKASQDKTRLAALNHRFDDNLARIAGESKGIFDDHDDDAEQTWHDPAIVQDDKIIAAKLGSIPPAFESPVRRPSDEDEAQAKEDFLVYLHDEHRRQHTRAGYGDLDMDAVKTITRYGRVVTSSVCNFEARPGQAPFVMRMIDPAVIYPTFQGERGITHATLVYNQRIGDVIGWHDRDGELERKVLATKNGMRGSTYTLDDEAEITEYWDCKWYALFVAGELVLGPIAHEYGEPPFVYTIAPFGDVTYTRNPSGNGDYVDMNGYQITQAQADLVRRGASYYYDRFVPHAQREAISAKLATRLAMWGDEPVWYEKQLDAGKRAEWSRARGARNEIPEGYRLVPGPDAPLPPTLSPLLALSNEAQTRGGLSPVDHGLAPAQTSGYAIAGMSEQGNQKLAPIKRTLETHWAAVGEQRLRFYRDWGHLLGDEGKRGTIEIPRMEMDPRPNASATWVLTPDMIDRSGTQVVCRLIDMPDTSTLTAMANALGMVGQQGAITRESKIRLLGLPGSRNPRATMQKIDIEALREMPEYKLAQAYLYARDELDDPELANMILMQMQKEQMKQQPPQAGPTQSQPGGAPGLSGPTMGVQPGREGGRPPGPPPMNAAMQGPPTER